MDRQNKRYIYRAARYVNIADMMQEIYKMIVDGWKVAQVLETSMYILFEKEVPVQES